MKDIGFNKAIEEWVKYCKTPRILLSSNMNLVKKCDAYDRLLSMDYEALPLIRELYNKNNSWDLGFEIMQKHGLVLLVEDIIGKDFQIPEKILGNISGVEEYTKNWLDQNMDKYIR